MRNQSDHPDQQPQSKPVTMHQVTSEEEYQPCPHPPYIHTPVYQQTSHSQYFGLYRGGPIRFLPEGTQNLPSMAMSSPHTPQPTVSCLQHFRESHCMQHHCMPPQPGPAGDLTACQLRNPSSSLPQGVAGASAHSAHSANSAHTKPLEDALQKRELRLMKNREAARECRRKKKEYVKCLENRVAVLENQNKTLIEELRALKDIYRHKVE